jgi:hypothetical protein
MLTGRREDEGVTYFHSTSPGPCTTDLRSSSVRGTPAEAMERGRGEVLDWVNEIPTALCHTTMASDDDVPYAPHPRPPPASLTTYQDPHRLPPNARPTDHYLRLPGRRQIYDPQVRIFLASTIHRPSPFIDTFSQSGMGTG